jgi:hypothetical protein
LVGRSVGLGSRRPVESISGGDLVERTAKIAVFSQPSRLGGTIRVWKRRGDEFTRIHREGTRDDDVNRGMGVCVAICVYQVFVSISLLFSADPDTRDGNRGSRSQWPDADKSLHRE